MDNATYNGRLDGLRVRDEVRERVAAYFLYCRVTNLDTGVQTEYRHFSQRQANLLISTLSEMREADQQFVVEVRDAE